MSASPSVTIPNHLPETIPKTTIQYEVEEDWGKATIYDLTHQDEDVRPEQEVVVPVIPRKSMVSKLFLFQDIIPDKTDEKLEHDIDDSQGELYCLPFFPAALFSTILEDTITQIRILVECNTVLRITKTLTDIGLLKALKYGVEQKFETDELAGIDPANLHCEEYKLNKLENDRNTIIDILTMMYSQLTIAKCFSSLLRFIEHIVYREEHSHFIAEDEARNRLVLKDLLRQLRQQRNHHKTVLYESESIMANLRSQVEDASLMAETKGRYVDNWQAARTEQHKEVIFQKESVFTDSTEYYKRRSDHEQRVHAEVESLTNIIIDETLRAVEEWMDKYDDDMEKIDLRIQIQRNDYQNMHAKRRDMERTYNKHDRQMREWNRFKEERAKARLYHDTMTKSALTVQAWWRGLLVRKQLGPFRPKKRGRGGKK